MENDMDNNSYIGTHHILNFAVFFYVIFSLADCFIIPWTFQQSQILVEQDVHHHQIVPFIPVAAWCIAVWIEGVVKYKHYVGFII